MLTITASLCHPLRCFRVLSIDTICGGISVSRNWKHHVQPSFRFCLYCENNCTSVDSILFDSSMRLYRQ